MVWAAQQVSRVTQLAGPRFACLIGLSVQQIHQSHLKRVIRMMEWNSFQKKKRTMEISEESRGSNSNRISLFLKRTFVFVATRKRFFCVGTPVDNQMIRAGSRYFVFLMDRDVLSCVASGEQVFLGTIVRLHINFCSTHGLGVAKLGFNKGSFLYLRQHDWSYVSDS